MSKVEEYILRVFPCQPPCDSLGSCDNCNDAILIRVGAEIQKKEDELIDIETIIMETIKNVSILVFVELRAIIVAGLIYTGIKSLTTGIWWYP